MQGHICAEVCDIDNEPLIKMVGPEIIQTVVSHDIIGRLMIQCARQPGLAAVWEQLMGFDGAPAECSKMSTSVSMLCYAMPCYAMICYAMRWYAGTAAIQVRLGSGLVVSVGMLWWVADWQCKRNHLQRQTM